MELLGSIPTTWDETIILGGKLGEYILTARKKDDNFYVAGMTNWQGRTVTVDFSFLDAGQYDAIVAVDGVNADRYPSDYIISKQIIDKTTKLPLAMANGGGFLITLKKR